MQLVGCRNQMSLLHFYSCSICRVSCMRSHLGLWLRCTEMSCFYIYYFDMLLLSSMCVHFEKIQFILTLETSHYFKWALEDMKLPSQAAELISHNYIFILTDANLHALLFINRLVLSPLPGEGLGRRSSFSLLPACNLNPFHHWIMCW